MSDLPLIIFADEFCAKPIRKPRFKHVTANLQKRAITIKTKSGWDYEIDLDDCTTAARLLDWILQIADRPAPARPVSCVFANATREAVGN